MAEGFLRPNGVSTRDLGTRKQEDGQFRQAPTYTKWGGFENAARGKMDRNRMTLERGGPRAVSGRPI
jgi:hypothetical protein